MCQAVSLVLLFRLRGSPCNENEGQQRFSPVLLFANCHGCHKPGPSPRCTFQYMCIQHRDWFVASQPSTHQSTAHLFSSFSFFVRCRERTLRLPSRGVSANSAGLARTRPSSCTRQRSTLGSRQQPRCVKTCRLSRPPSSPPLPLILNLQLVEKTSQAQRQDVITFSTSTAVSVGPTFPPPDTDALALSCSFSLRNP